MFSARPASYAASNVSLTCAIGVVESVLVWLDDGLDFLVLAEVPKVFVVHRAIAACGSNVDALLEQGDKLSLGALRF